MLIIEYAALVLQMQNIVLELWVFVLPVGVEAWPCYNDEICDILYSALS